jgi:hypothetical protein
MKKLALALATTAALGFAAPALAADTDMSGTKAQTQAPAGQTTARRRRPLQRKPRPLQRKPRLPRRPAALWFSFSLVY